MSERPGCLLLAPLLALTGGSGGRRLTAGPTLRTIAWASVHADDRPMLAKARAAAEACLHALGSAGKPLGTSVTTEVASEIVKLFDCTVRVAEELGRARAFVRQNEPSRLARERAEVEVKQMTAGSIAERKMLADAMRSLADRERHAATVTGEIGVLSARLMAAAASLEALHARLDRAALTADEASARAQAAIEELKQQEQDAERALAAYAATAREIALVGSP